MIADPTQDSPVLDDQPPADAAAMTIVICETCRREGDLAYSPRAGALLAAATEAAAVESGVRIRRVSCLANCKRASSAAIIRDGGWTYVFGDLDPATAGPDLVAGALLLAGSVDGLMPWRGRPLPLKRGMIARVPPLPTLEESS